jgi:hypothetical protein
MLALVLLALVAIAAGCLQVIGYEEPRPGWTGTSDEDAGATGGHDGGGGAPVCTPGSKRACYSGPAGTNGIGICKAGTTTCKADGSGYGDCAGEVTPAAETCASTDDEDCDGHDCAKWAELFGDGAEQFGNAVAVDSSGNVYVAGDFYGALPFPGHTLIASGFDAMFVAKFDPGGKHLWSNQFSGGMTQGVSTIAVDAAGNVVIGGYSIGTISFGGETLAPGAFVAKFDASGMHSWSRSFGGSTACGLPFGTSAVGAVAFDPKGDVIAAGAFCGSADFGSGPVPSAGNTDAFVVKLRGADGSMKASDGAWANVFGDGLAQSAGPVAVDAAGKVLVAGTFYGSMTLGSMTLTSAGNSDAFLAKLKPDGTVSWTQAFASTGADTALSLAVDPLGGPILAGRFGGAINFGGGPVDVVGGSSNRFVVKYSAGHLYQWAEVFSGDALLSTASVASDASGNVFVVTGYQGKLGLGTSTLMSAGKSDILLAKLDASTGAPVWYRSFGDDADQQPGGIGVAPDGSPIITGGVGGEMDFGTGVLKSAGGGDLLIAKFSP